jgi:Family of unknown function (DUF5522)/Cysteine-rich CWC
MPQHEIKACAACNQPFECRVGDVLRCHCTSVELNEAQRQSLADTYDDCLCHQCLQEFSDGAIPQKEEAPDFYIENGRYVFTAHYLQRRGYCCGSGCRHCPYPKQKLIYRGS